MTATAFLRVVRASYVRTLTKLVRRPVALTFSLAQPLAWMTLFGFLFERFTPSGAYAGLRYLDFVVPGIACMSCLFGASQAGVEWVRDLQLGVLQRALATPAPRAALVLGKASAEASRAVVQALCVVALGAALSAEVQLPPAGLALGLCAAALFTFAFACVSCTVGVLARAPEGMAAFVHVVNMPLLFTSTALVNRPSMPEPLATIAAHNPLSLAVDALRLALVRGGCAEVVPTLAPLLTLALVAYAAATWALRRAAQDPA